MRLPESLERTLEFLLAQIGSSWDVDETTKPDRLWSSPLGELVVAFGDSRKGSEAHRRLSWLTMFAARRALPCWELYCDGRQPQEAVESVRAFLVNGYALADLERLSKPAVPSWGGVLITDCRECDTSCASGAAAYCVQYAASADPIKAACALSGADMAFDQSPLGIKEKFRAWLIDFAVPIAYERREMTLGDQNAYRDYDPDNL